jgi:CheY-like chemotaxis protein
MKGDRERCIAEGMSGYVVKPIHPDHLSRNGARQRIRIRK